MPSRPIKILPQFFCGSLLCAPRCAKGCEHKINIITLFYRNNSKISIVYTCFLQYIQRLYSRQRIDIRAFLTVGAFLQNLGALILGKFCVLTKRGFETILDVTPQLSLCCVALKKLWVKRENGRLKTHLSPGTEKGLPQNSSFCDRPFVYLIALSAFYFLMMFSHQRCMIAAISARVAVPVGARRPPFLPFSTPAPTAHCRAGIAYSLACRTST